MSRITIRQAEISDYDAYFHMEEIAWKNTGIKPIDQDTFESWLQIFPTGCLVSHNSQGELVGLVASQICNFDPYDSAYTQKTFDQATDNGYLKDSHDSSGNALYIVTNSAIHAGSGYKMMSALCALSVTLGKQYCLGSCRLPGLERASRQSSATIDRTFVWEYVQEIAKRLPKSKRTYALDPVLSILIKYPDAQIYDVVQNFLSENDQQSMNWSCVMGWENPDYV